MKLTQKSIKHETETTEWVCEMTRPEFEMLCAKTAAKLVAGYIKETECEADDITASLAMTAFLASFVSELNEALFDNPETIQPKNDKEEK